MVRNAINIASGFIMGQAVIMKDQGLSELAQILNEHALDMDIEIAKEIQSQTPTEGVTNAGASSGNDNDGPDDDASANEGVFA